MHLVNLEMITIFLDNNIIELSHLATSFFDLVIIKLLSSEMFPQLLTF